MSNSNQDKKFFDLHTRGIGYVSRIREVTPKKGAKFLACTIAALTGSSDSVEYRYFDTTVVGSDASALIRKCQEAVSENRKVLVSFNIGDLWIDTFTYAQGDKKGTTGFSLKGRLLAIDWIKVDSELVYSKVAEAAEAEAESSDVAAGSVKPIESAVSGQAANDREFQVDGDEYAIYTSQSKINESFDSLVSD